LIDKVAGLFQHLPMIARAFMILVAALTVTGLTSCCCLF
jgi:hypothetical protein